MPVDVGNFDPKFMLFVEDNEIPEDVTRFIPSVEFESSDGVVDMVSLEVVNPRGVNFRSATDSAAHPFMWSDKKLFYPGNMLDLFMGYKQPLTYMTRVRLVEPEYTFPESGTPSFVIKGYSADYQMTVNSPSSPRHLLGEKLTKEQKSAQTRGRILDRDIAKVVEQVATSAQYGFIPDVDPVDMKLPEQTFQRVGMSDHDLVKGLSNMTGYIFWVDHFKGFQSGFSEDPILHFKNPALMKFNRGFGLQKVRYTFRYGAGDQSTLLSFNPTFTIRGLANKIIAAVTMKDGRVIEQEVAFKVQPSGRIDMEYTGVLHEDVLRKELQNAGQIQVNFNDFSVDLMPIGQSFEDPASLDLFLANWFARTHEQFIQASASTIGLENLMARQIHQIEGFGTAMDGLYYFPRVRHIMSSTAGYRCDASVRKIIGVAPESKAHLIVPEEVPL